MYQISNIKAKSHIIIEGIKHNFKNAINIFFVMKYCEFVQVLFLSMQILYLWINFQINQKYKATIRKFPTNWPEVKKHLKRQKADIFKKVFDLKYQTVRKTFPYPTEGVLKQFSTAL